MNRVIICVDDPVHRLIHFYDKDGKLLKTVSAIQATNDPDIVAKTLQRLQSGEA